MLYVDPSVPLKKSEKQGGWVIITVQSKEYLLISYNNRLRGVLLERLSSPKEVWGLGGLKICASFVQANLCLQDVSIVHLTINNAVVYLEADCCIRHLLANSLLLYIDFHLGQGNDNSKHKIFNARYYVMMPKVSAFIHYLDITLIWN